MCYTPFSSLTQEYEVKLSSSRFPAFRLHVRLTPHWVLGWVCYPRHLASHLPTAWEGSAVTPSHGRAN